MFKFSRVVSRFIILGLLSFCLGFISLSGLTSKTLAARCGPICVNHRLVCASYITPEGDCMPILTQCRVTNYPGECEKDSVLLPPEYY